jgi:hypothetical protein
MSKRKIIRRFRAGADEGISIVDDNGETYIHIDLNNETHLSELINMICYNISINGIIDLRNILKSDEFNTLLNNPAKQSISTINEMIQKLSPYSELKNISNIIQLLNSIIQLSSIDTSNKVDEHEIKRQEELQKQAIYEAEIQMKKDKESETKLEEPATNIEETKNNDKQIVDETEIEKQEILQEQAKNDATIQMNMDKEPETNIEETKNNDKQIVDETEIKKQKILQEQAEQIIKNDNELDELYKRTINDVKDIQTKSEDLFRQAYDIDNKKLETEPNNVQENKEVVPRIAEEEKTQISDIKGIYQEIKNPPPRIRALKQGGVLKFKRNSKSKSRKKKTK